MTTSQQHTLELSVEAFEMLGASLGPLDGDPSQPVRDIIALDGRTVIDQGRPHAGYEDLCNSLVDAQGMAVITLSEVADSPRSGKLLDGPGPDPVRASFVWWSHYGMTTAEPILQGYRLHLEGAGGLYRFLLDATGLGPRPEPSAPVRLKPSREVMQWFALEDSQAPDGEAARRALAHDLEASWPELADDIRTGTYRQVTVAAQFNGVDGLKETGTWYLDSPQGLLVHVEEPRSFRANRHTLVSSPSWQLWAELLETLPTPQDVEVWLEEAATTHFTS